MIVPSSREGQTQKNMQYFYSQLSVLLAFICKAGAASKLLKIARAQSPHNFKKRLNEGEEDVRGREGREGNRVKGKEESSGLGNEVRRDRWEKRR